jgi:hypothetical protein
MEKGSSHGQMDADLKETMLMTRNTETGISHGLMEDHLKALGLTENKTESENTSTRKEKSSMVNGKTGFE